MIDPRNPDYTSTPAHPGRAAFAYAPAASRSGLESHASAQAAGLCHLKSPAVSIMTPYYNTGPIFRETATSIFRQSFQHWEWIIVNDGSANPEALAVLDEYRAIDPRVRVLDLPENRGLSAARNAGYAAARADLVMQIDSDDLAEPTFLEKCVWFLRTNPQWGFVCGWTVGFGADNYLWGRGFHDLDKFLHENLVTPTALVRKSVWQAAGGYDESNRKGLEDWDFWLRCAAAGHWGTCLPEFLDWYRRRPNHTSSWGNWDRGPNQEKFSAELREKYAGLYATGLPRPKITWPSAMAPLPAESPVANPLAKTKPRLLMIVPWLRFGGADKFNLDLIEQATKRGYEITVVATLEGDQSWQAHYTRLTPDVFVLEKFLRPADRVSFLRAIIESRRPDVVMVTNSELGYHALPYLRSCCPDPAYVDLTHIEEENWKSGGYPRYAAASQDQLDLNIVVSDHLKGWMVARGADADRVEVCHINVDPGVWKPDEAERARVRGELGIGEGVAALLYPARLTAQKQPRVLAESIKRLVEELRGCHQSAAAFGRATGEIGPDGVTPGSAPVAPQSGRTGGTPDAQSATSSDFVVIIAGDGEDRAYLESFWKQHGLESRVRMLGAQPPERMPGLFRASDILFLPSKWEGIALSIFEAMAAGLCVVGAVVGGQRELVTDDTGVLLDVAGEPADVQAAAYAGTLAELIRDPARRAELGATARRRIETGFTLDAMGARMIDLFAHAGRLREQSPRVALPRRLAEELAVRSIDYFRLQKVCERAARGTADKKQPASVGGPTAKKPAAAANGQLGGKSAGKSAGKSGGGGRKGRKGGKKAGSGRDAGRRRRAGNQTAMAASLTELKVIEGSRAWRAIEGVRRSWPYAVYARLRFGKGWRYAADAARALPPDQRLVQIKQSGAFRMLCSVKRSAVYRMMRRPAAPSPAR